MKDGMIVKVRLAGDDLWHFGTVIKARKQWVEFNDDDEMAPFIADESNIVDWVLILSNTSGWD